MNIPKLINPSHSRRKHTKKPSVQWNIVEYEFPMVGSITGDSAFIIYIKFE